MTSESWNAAKSLFGVAFELDPDAREQLLSTTDAASPAIVEHVRALLASRAHAAPSFLEPPPPCQVEEALAASSRGPGSVRLGPYEIREELGRGASSIVYLAVRVGDGLRVAVKVLAPHLVHEGEARARMAREARAAARLSHPGLVPVLFHGEAAGVPFLALELACGETLHRRLERIRADASVERVPVGCDPHDPRTAAFIALQLADALEHCHERGLLHGDVKPDNVSVTEQGRARLLDFGICRDLGWPARSSDAPRLGTVPYMSPEQLQEPAADIDPRSDVYALGATLYEMLTLRRAFDGASPARIVEQILGGALVPVRARAPRVPRRLAALCEKALSVEREDRFPSAGALAAALRGYLAAVDAPQTGPRESPADLEGPGRRLCDAPLVR